MENPVNPSEKSHFPWGWVAGGCGLLAIVVIAVVVVFINFALPAIQNIIDNRSTLANPLSTPRVNPTAVPNRGFGNGKTPVVPNPGSGNGTTIADLPFKFSAVQDPASMSGQSLMDQMSSSLNLNTDTDFMAPKSYEGSASLDPSADFTLGNGWCAKDSNTLQQNLANMKYQLSINGNNIDLSPYPMLFFTDDQGHACAETGISITPSGTLAGSYHIVLIQTYLNSLDDGITPSPYPAGDVKFDFSIQFRVTPPPGSST